MRNKYGGYCYRCGEWCKPGSGHFERHAGGFRVQHADCAIKYRGTDHSTPPVAFDYEAEKQMDQDCGENWDRFGDQP